MHMFKQYHDGGMFVGHSMLVLTSAAASPNRALIFKMSFCASALIGAPTGRDDCDGQQKIALKPV